MKYEKIISGTFIDRPNRFIAHVLINNKIETVHVKNTGRCKELLIPGCNVIMEDFGDRPQMNTRKTRYDLIAVYKSLDKTNPLYNKHKSILINMDSQAPNKVVEEWLKDLPKEAAYDVIKPEYTFGDSRIDFYMEKKTDNNIQKYLMEVKGCTLEKDGKGFFPDAPTQRGVKHLEELAKACKAGYKCFLAFVIQIPDVKEVFPNMDTHPQFGHALEDAKKAGVEILFLQCSVEENRLSIIY